MAFVTFVTLVIDFIIHIDQHLSLLLVDYGVWIYAILFFIVFCETGLIVTPFLPGDSLLFVAGALWKQNDMNLSLLLLLIITAAILGDAVNYAAGRFFGERLFRNPSSRIFRRDYLQKAQDFYAQHGGKTLVIARFMPILRTFVPFVAGMSTMKYKHFCIYNVVGAISWTLCFCVLGYFFGGIEIVKKNISVLALAVIFLSLLPMIIAVLRAKYWPKANV